MAMTRAALLLTVGDPYLLEFWFETYNKVWSKEVDKLYVSLDKRDGLMGEAVAYSKRLCERNGATIVETEVSDISNGIKVLFDACKEELFLLVQDDAPIFRKHSVEQQLERIESGEVDAIGTLIKNYGPEKFNEQLIKKFKHDDWKYHPYRGEGYAFWQNFFFGKIKDIRATDGNLQVETWPRNKYVPFLDITLEQDCSIDIFVSMTLQMRAAGVRFAYVPQYTPSREDFVDYMQRKNIFDGSCPWMHIAHMSSIYMAILNNGWEMLTSYSDGDQKEYERRMAWWQMLIKRYPQVREELPEFSGRFENVLGDIRRNLNLNPDNINRREAIYKEVIGYE